MKRMLILILAALLLTGCAKQDVYYGDTELSKAEECGTVPEEYKGIIENDLLNGLRIRDCAAFGDRFLVERRSGEGGEITLYDSLGAPLARHFISKEELNDRIVDLLLATSDGGFIYSIRADVVSDSHGGAVIAPARIVKCGADGAVEWTAAPEGNPAGPLCCAFERNGAYYVFGEYDELPAGGYSHILMLKLGPDGKLLKRNTVAGSDFDFFRWAEETETGFRLHVDSQSRDGDFFKLKREEPPYCGRYFIVETDLELEEKNVTLGKTDHCDRSYYSAGTLKGESIEQNRGMKDVPGYVKLVIDNGDSYLVVSENNTDIFEGTPPMVSAIWYYTETVYSVFDKDGKLIARRTFDSSPDWELIGQALYAG